jgi:hypothetical protein
MQSPCNPLTENYSKIFYMINEGDIASIQCKMKVGGPKSTRKVNALSLPFVDFYVSAFISITFQLPRSSLYSFGAASTENTVS